MFGTLGWVSVVLENSQILTRNIYLRVLNHISELVVNEKQNSKPKNGPIPGSMKVFFYSIQFQALEAQIF